MLYSVVAFFVIAAGSTIVVLSTIRYYKLLEYYKEESYQTLQASWTVNLVLFYIFILGFILGGLYVLFNEVTKSYVFIALIFLVISVYIYFTVKNQVNAGFMLKNKILEAIKTFVDIIDQKDFTSSGHSRQVYDIVGLFYEELDDYKKVLNKVKLLDAAILHDIGKINISVEIFKGKQQLTVEEWNIIKSHPQIGKEMLDKTFFQ
jgi:HD-GYP domain-containing protein (c-di-GMP phosphodiesterase class II)